jgi:uncharacterized protein with FMN-binding domain
MKRILFTLIGTVAGLVALLDFKTQQPVTPTGALPQAGLSDTGTTTSPAARTPSTSPSTAGGSSAPSPSTASNSRNYVGDAITTRYGIVQVKVTVSGGKITNVGFVQLQAFDGRSAQINQAAAPILLQETISAQSAQVDTVSGATYTSDGYVQSLQSALTAAGIR